MKYMGSKSRYAKYILPLILKDREPNQYYVEPFCGGCGVISKVNGPRIASDINPYLICLLKSLQEGWIPPENLTEEEYNNLKKECSLNPLTAFAGFGCSFGAKWFGGFARGKDGNDNPRNYAAETKKNLLKQSFLLKDILFYNKSYLELEIPENSIIYCDPPYQGTTKYKDGNFDYEQFWNWVREKSINNQVFVSEYNAPQDFECLWEKEVTASFDHNRLAGNVKKERERLFKYKQ